MQGIMGSVVSMSIGSVSESVCCDSVSMFGISVAVNVSVGCEGCECTVGVL